MAEFGRQRSRRYVTNAVKHFKVEPRGKRRLHKTPAQKEADACAHGLEGGLRVLRDRGPWSERPDGTPVLVTLHPSALLRGDPAQMDAAYSAGSTTCAWPSALQS